MLYTLFEWAAAPGSRLVLVGIANALDLTERFLPRLRARDATPTALHFPPYSDAELGAIVKQRLAPAALAVASAAAGGSNSADHMAAAIAASASSAASAPASTSASAAPPDPSRCVIDSNAVQFCSKKVANASGDARRALEVSRLAVDRALDELSAPLPAMPPWAPKPLIRFEHMSAALSVAFKSPIISLLASLPHHQQVLLCSMVLRSRRIAATAAAQAAAAAAAQAQLDATSAASAMSAPKPSAASSSFLLQAHPKSSAKASAKSGMLKAAAGGGPSAGQPGKSGGASSTVNRCTLLDLHREYSKVCAAQQLRALSTDEIVPMVSGE